VKVLRVIASVGFAEFLASIGFRRELSAGGEQSIQHAHAEL
jgi:hypothetical protein